MRAFFSPVNGSTPGRIAPKIPFEMEERFPNLLAALRAACKALPDNLALRAHLNELSGNLSQVERTGPPRLHLVLSDLGDDESLPLTHAV